MINQDHLALFTAGLRSGRFKQGTGYLTQNPGTDAEENCCLGVGCIVAMENGLALHYQDQGDLRYYVGDHVEPDYDGTMAEAAFHNAESLPQLAYEWYGFPDCDPDILIPLDDSGKYDPDNGTMERVTASTANDDHGLTFAEIADAFERTYGPDRE